MEEDEANDVVKPLDFKSFRLFNETISLAEKFLKEMCNFKWKKQPHFTILNEKSNPTSSSILSPNSNIHPIIF